MNSFAFNPFLLLGRYMNGIIHFTAQFCLVILLLYVISVNPELFRKKIFVASREQIHHLASHLLLSVISL